MKFVLFVEGPTERDVLPGLFKRCLDPKLKNPVGIQAVNFHGWANLWRDLPQKAKFYLHGPAAASDIIGVISLMDLYGPDIYPATINSGSERLLWAKNQAEERVQDSRFRQFFAVHELEAWLFSQPQVFPKEVRGDIEALSATPENLNFVQPPKKRLDDIYGRRLKRSYQARVDGARLFRRLGTELLCERCPRFSEMIGELISLAKQANQS